MISCSADTGDGVGYEGCLVVWCGSRKVGRSSGGGRQHKGRHKGNLRGRGEAAGHSANCVSTYIHDVGHAAVLTWTQT